MSNPILGFARRLAPIASQVDWGVVLALAIGLFAAMPFLTRGGLPHRTDAELHVYRTAELKRAVDEGVLYPRWAGNLYLGYGYPIFNYYAPLTYHLGGAFARILPDASIVTATKSVFVLGLLLAPIGAYLLGRRLCSPAGGIIAAASFTLCPYVAFIDPHGRGDLAEHFAICLMPLAFYYVRRLMDNPRPSLLLGSVLSVSAIVFSHNLLGLVVSGLLLAYWGWEAALGPDRRKSLWALSAFALAAGLIASFWLPALLESDAVKLEVIGPGHFDYREHFSKLSELLAPSRLIDWGAAGTRFRHNLGLAQWLLALPVVAVAARQLKGAGARSGGPRVGFFLAGSVGLGFAMLPPSESLWRLVPGIPYLQFPWRLLGPTNLMLAVCSASMITLVPQRWRTLTATMSFAVLILAALPLLYPPPWEADFGGTSPLDIIRWERESQALGTTSTGDFLPKTVDMIPSPANTLIRSYAEPGPIDKVNRATVPETAYVTVLRHSPTHDLLRVTSAEPFVLRLYTFLFPGWRAYVDGRPTDIEIARPEGFITVRVPEGEHTVLVRFENTAVRKVGWAVSGATLAVLIGVIVLWKRKDNGNREPSASVLGRRESLWSGGTLLLILLLKVAIADPQGWLHLRSAPGQALPAQHPVHAEFGGKIELIAYDLPQRQVQAGDSLSLILYWRALGAVNNNYQSFVHVAQPLEAVWAQEDHLNPGGLPTERWPLDKYVWDEYEIRIPPETPPGEYSLNVGLYLRSEGYRLERYEDGRPVGDSLVLTSVTVTR